jgi:predicted RNA-binding protein with PIN domain
VERAGGKRHAVTGGTAASDVPVGPGHRYGDDPAAPGAARPAGAAHPDEPEIAAAAPATAPADAPGTPGHRAPEDGGAAEAVPDDGARDDGARDVGARDETASPDDGAPDAADDARADHAGDSGADDARADNGDESDGDGSDRDSSDGESLDRPLPEGVRHRVVTVAAEAFGTLTTAELPAQLRQFARFTPSRRARFAGNALAAALETEPTFRQRIAARLREAQPELAEALDAGAPPPAADPLDVAAAAYLLRPPGWAKLVAAAGEEAQRAHADQVGEETARELQRVKQQLAQLRAAAHDEARAARAELETVRKEADSLQRKLRSATSDLRRGEAALRKLEGELAQVRSAAAADRTAAESEARRLRTRLAEAEAAVEAGRRAAREGRSLGDMRLRLLLDTVLDAAQGLRRELALPPLRERPADAVDAVAPGAIGPKDIARRALAEDDPQLLDQLLALPQAHVVVDGYNVTKTGYPTLPLEKQRLRLLGGLAGLAAQTGAEITCVFDGADLAAPVLLAPPRGVRVLFSKAGETADELIRRLVRAEPAGRPVVVVSADREVADGVARAGARPVSSTLLLRRLSRM